MPVTTHVTQLFIFTEVTKQIFLFFYFFVPVEQMKKGKPNTGSEAHSMENMFDHFVKDVPQGPTPGAKSKEKPGKIQPLKRITIHISIANCHLMSLMSQIYIK